MNVYSTSEVSSMLQITDIARDKIQELLEHNKGKYVRISIQGAG